MGAPWGRALVAVVGIAVVAAGLYHVHKGVTRTFLQEFERRWDGDVLAAASNPAGPRVLRHSTDGGELARRTGLDALAWLCTELERGTVDTALVLANHPEFVALKFAISRAGAVCIPINFLNRRDELGYVLRQSGAVLLVTMDRFRDLDYLGMLDELAPGVPFIPEIWQGHVNSGEGFWTALERLEEWL